MNTSEGGDSVIDSPDARAFVDRAATHPAAGRISDKRAPRPLTLRIPKDLHSRLLFIAKNGSKSINQFVIDALGPPVDAQIEKIAKRKTLGLD